MFLAGAKTCRWLVANYGNVLAESCASWLQVANEAKYAFEVAGRGNLKPTGA